LKLSYKGISGKVSNGVNEPYSISSTADYLTMSINQAAIGSFHAGIFNEINDTKYFMLVNKIAKDTIYQNVLNIKIGNGASGSCVNWKVQNIEGGSDIYCSNSISSPITINKGEGYLYKALPAIKYGGRIVSNETISSATTLNGALTVAAGCTLTVNGTYTINNDITVEDGGAIAISGYGNIVFNNGAKINQSWSQCLLIGDQNDHPQIIWTPDNSSNVTGYKIYSDYTTPSYAQVASISGNSTCNWLDALRVSGPFPKYVNYYVKKTYTDNSLSTSTNTSLILTGEARPKKTGEQTTAEIQYNFKCENYPNPFNPATTISYEIPSYCKVTLKVFDILGKEITTLVNSYKAAGIYKVSFDASNLPSGVYIYRLEAGANIDTKKMILTK